MSQLVPPNILLSTSLYLRDVHCKESLVWFEASGFCYTDNARPPLGLQITSLPFGRDQLSYLFYQFKSMIVDLCNLLPGDV